MNKVFLTGKIAETPTLRMEFGEAAHLTMGLSVRHRTHSGEVRSEIYRISAWNNCARWGSDHLKRGQIIGIQGYLTQHRTQNERNPVTIIEVVAEEIFPMGQVRTEEGSSVSDSESEAAV